MIIFAGKNIVEMIREKIEEHMHERGVNQTMLCTLLGLTVQNLNAFLHGKRSMPYKHLMKIMLYLKVTAAREGEDGMVPADMIYLLMRDSVSKQNKKYLELSEETGINRSVLSSYFNGKRGITVNQLEVLLSYFGMDIVKLQNSQA